jgi:hypothetical protein
MSPRAPRLVPPIATPRENALDEDEVMRSVRALGGAGISFGASVRPDAAVSPMDGSGGEGEKDALVHHAFADPNRNLLRCSGKNERQLAIETSLGRDGPVAMGLGVIVIAELAGLRVHIDEKKECDFLCLVADIVHAQHDIRLGPIDRDGLGRDLDRAELLGLAKLRRLRRRPRTLRDSGSGDEDRKEADEQRCRYRSGHVTSIAGFLVIRNRS